MMIIRFRNDKALKHIWDVDIKVFCFYIPMFRYVVGNTNEKEHILIERYKENYVYPKKKYSDIEI